MDEDNGQCYEDTGVLQPLSDSDTTILFRDLEHELEVMVQRYHVPPGDLEKIFQVVQTMFDMMDASKDAYEQLEEQKNELEELWKTEKDKLRVTQRRKLELECRLEEERMRVESEKMMLEKEKVVLETKLKQVTEHKSNIEQDFHRLRDKTDRDEQMRRDLMDQYKKQYETAKRTSLRRIASMRSSRHRHGITSPESQLMTYKAAPGRVAQQTPDSTLESSGQEDSTPPSGTPESVISDLSEATHPTSPLATASRSSRISSLEEELQQAKAAGVHAQFETQLSESQPVFLESYEETTPTHYPQNGQSLPDDSESDEDIPSWAILGDTNENPALSLANELMAVDPTFLMPPQGEMEVLAEVEVLQKEREVWDEERVRLEQEKRELRRTKEGLESHNAQLQLELGMLRQSQKDLHEELTDVRKERDEILETYLDQPFDEYCITKKELHDLLKRHHKTAIELEKAEEDKLRLQRLLESKRTLFERFKSRLKKVFSHYSRPSSSVSPPARRPSSTPSKDRAVESHSSYSPPLSPLIRSITSTLRTGEFSIMRDWLFSQAGRVSVDILPSWVGQIPLKGIETERIECAALGRIYLSAVDELPSHMSPPRPRVVRRHSAFPYSLPTLQQTHTEVWVATCEASVAYIEIVDILSKPAKFRQRFVVKPRTRHIICMKAIPGRVEESKTTSNSFCFSPDTSWVDSAYSPSPTQLPGQRRPGSNPFHNIRPRSCPTTRRRSTPISRMEPLDTINSPGIMSADSTRGRGGRSTTDGGGLTSLGERDMVEMSQGFASTLTESSSLPKESYVTPEKVRSTRFEFTPPYPLAAKMDWATRSEPGNLVSEDIERVQLRARHIHQGMLQRGIIPEDPGPIPIHGLESSPLGLELPDFGESPLSPTRSRVRNGCRRQRPSKDTVLMWIVTEDNKLYFYPTTDPSHLPLNIVELHSRALCIEYIGERVFVGHVQSEISVYHQDEIADSWDIDNPERITLPTYDPSENFDVKCIAAVGHQVWVGAGPSIFILDGETLNREGSIFLDRRRRRPEQIITLGNNMVVVTTKGSVLFVFDAKSAPPQLVRKFDVFPATRLLDRPQRVGSSVVTAPTNIKSIVADKSTVYVGSSNGRIVAVPIENLLKAEYAELDVETSIDVSDDHSTAAVIHGGSKVKGDPDVTAKKTDGIYQEQCAVSLHTQKDNKVQSLIYIPLPTNKLSRPKDTASLQQTTMYNSLPNLGSMYTLSICQPLYKSLLVSIGKGHVLYSSDVESVEESSPLRERNESFQLLVWGHRNTLS